MNPVLADVAAVESDPRFPSGAWTGFFLQWWLPGRHMMAIDLAFTAGQMQATGSDIVGPFAFQGEYDPATGKCHWIKNYLGRHSVTYTGSNEGEGIWGAWEIRLAGGLYKDQGVFHIWPVGMAPTEAAQATVQAYLTHLRVRCVTKLFGLGIAAAVVFAGYHLIQNLWHNWTTLSLP